MFDRLTRGFGLMEMLVVVVIISVLSTVVVLQFRPGNNAPSPEEQLLSVGRAMDAICEQALFRSKAQVLQVHREGLLWVIDSVSAQVADSMGREVVSWPDQWRVDLSVEGHAVGVGTKAQAQDGSRPQLLCDPLGQKTSFELGLQSAQQSARLFVPQSGQWAVRITGP